MGNHFSDVFTFKNESGTSEEKYERTSSRTFDPSVYETFSREPRERNRRSGNPLLQDYLSIATRERNQRTSLKSSHAGVHKNLGNDNLERDSGRRTRSRDSDELHDPVLRYRRTSSRSSDPLQQEKLSHDIRERRQYDSFETACEGETIYLQKSGRSKLNELNVSDRSPLTQQEHPRVYNKYEKTPRDPLECFTRKTPTPTEKRSLSDPDIITSINHTTTRIQPINEITPDTSDAERDVTLLTEEDKIYTERSEEKSKPALAIENITHTKHTATRIQPTDDITPDSRDAEREVTLLSEENQIITEGSEGKSVSEPAFDLNVKAWEMCLDQPDFEQSAKDLLKEGKIPDKRLLETICSRYNRKSNIVKMICHHICSLLKRLSDLIIQVWPAYRYVKNKPYLSNKNQVFFVMITKKHIKLTTELNTYQRCILDISPHCKTENSEIKKQETKVKLPDKVAEDLQECLRKKARTLMENHSNLNRVSLGWIKGSGYAAGSGSWKESPCIALYVHVKGLVPLCEDPFDESVQKFDVDVREGVFELCGRANEFHQNIKMGCAIDTGYGTKQGTVGPFVKYELDPHMYYITSAHVVLDPEQWQEMKDKKSILFSEFGHETFQPPESESIFKNERHPLGKTVLAVYKEGNETEAGVEVALVRIRDDRIPSDGTFPDSSTIFSREFSAEDPFVFSTGEVIEGVRLSQLVVVYKFGGVSGLTKGKCRLNGASSVKTGTLHCTDLGFNITLHGQIEIIDYEDSVQFGDEGDSGSLVLTKQGDTLMAVGIFEGKMGDTYFVTPIQDILQELGVLLSRNRQPPQRQDMEMDIEELYSPMAIKVNYTEPSHNLDHQFASNTRENLDTNIAYFTDHKINSMKTELADLRTELVRNINQMDQNMKLGFDNVTQQIETLKQFFSNQPK